MSQNRDDSPTFGGAGTGATDAGTTREGGGTGYAGGTGGGMTTTGGQGTGTAATRAQQITEQAQEYGQRIAGAATQAKDYVSDKVGVVGDRIKDLQNKDFTQVTEEAKEYARQRPGQALLISAAAGFVIGLLIRGTRR